MQEGLLLLLPEVCMMTIGAETRTSLTGSTRKSMTFHCVCKKEVLQMVDVVFVIDPSL